MTQRILAALALDQQAPDVLRLAHSLVGAEGGRLALCHVVPNPFVASALFPHVNQDAAAQVTEVERSAREAVEKLVAQELPGVEPELFVELGGAASEIVRRAEAWGAELIVTGSHGRRGIERVLLGSVAASVMRYAHSSVYVQRQPSGSACVLAATDLSDAALPALSAAAREARRLGLPLNVLYVLEPSWTGLGAAAAAPFGVTPALPTVDIQRELLDSARKTLETAMVRAGAEGQALVAQGPAASTIVLHAEQLEAALIVVGSRGRTGIARVLLGSVAEAVSSSAPCSVLAVR